MSSSSRPVSTAHERTDRCFRHRLLERGQGLAEPPSEEGVPRDAAREEGLGLGVPEAPSQRDTAAVVVEGKLQIVIFQDGAHVVDRPQLHPDVIERLGELEGADEHRHALSGVIAQESRALGDEHVRDDRHQVEPLGDVESAVAHADDLGVRSIIEHVAARQLRKEMGVAYVIVHPSRIEARFDARDGLRDRPPRMSAALILASIRDARSVSPLPTDSLKAASSNGIASS